MVKSQTETEQSSCNESAIPRKKESGMGMGQNPADPSHPQAGHLPKLLPSCFPEAIPEGKAPCGLSAELCIEKTPGKTDPTPNSSPSPPELDPCVQTQELGWDLPPSPIQSFRIPTPPSPFPVLPEDPKGFFFPTPRDLSWPSLLAHP